MKKILALLLGDKTQTPRKTIADYKMDLMVKQGREQFKRLLDKGLSVPVALL